MKQGSNQGLRFMWFNEYKRIVTEDGQKPLTPIMGLFGGIAVEINNPRPTQVMTDDGPQMFNEIDVDRCEAGVCLGTPVRCDSPPAPSCEDDAKLVVWERPGRCEDGGP